MSRKLRVILVVLLALFVGALAAFGKNGSRPTGRSVVLTGDAGTKLFKPCSRRAPEGVEGYWTPTTRDIRALDAVFPKFIETQKLPRSVMAKSLTAKDVNRYYFQCAGFVRKGRKLIYINAFAPEIKQELEQSMKGSSNTFNWKRSPMIVCDGSTNLFGVEFDPTAHQFTNLFFDGPFIGQ